MRHAHTAIGHAVAAAIVLSSTLVFTLLGYFGLLAWAVLAGEPIGGALALPFLLLFSLVGGCVSILVVLFPATLLSHFICRSLRWAFVVEIPIATVISIAICVAVGGMVGALAGTVEQGIRIALVWELVLLVPLGLYWWSLQGTTSLLGFARKMWCRLTGQSEPLVGNGAG